MAWDWLLWLALALGAYFLGSVPTGYIVVRLTTGEDLRRVGSKNVGAVNAYQQAGAWAGIRVLLADTGKGALAILAPGWLGAAPWLLLVTSVLAVAGHNWPVFLNFQGGKGAAVVLGVSLAFLPALTMIAVAPTVLVMIVTRNVIIGAFFGFLLLNSLIVATGQDASQIALCLCLTVLVSATYLISVRKQLGIAVENRDWKGLFYGTGPPS